MLSNFVETGSRNSAIGSFEAKMQDFVTEASLRMVAPGAGFRGGTLYRPKNK